MHLDYCPSFITVLSASILPPNFYSAQSSPDVLSECRSYGITSVCPMPQWFYISLARNPRVFIVTLLLLQVFTLQESGTWGFCLDSCVTHSLISLDPTSKVYNERSISRPKHFIQNTPALPPPVRGFPLLCLYYYFSPPNIYLVVDDLSLPQEHKYLRAGTPCSLK